MKSIKQLTINNLEELKKEIEDIKKELKDKTLEELRELRTEIQKNITELELSEKRPIVVDFQLKYDYAVKVHAINIDHDKKNYECFAGPKLSTYKEDTVEDGAFVFCARFDKRRSNNSDYYLYKMSGKEPTLILQGLGSNLISFIYDCYNVFYNIEEDAIIDELQDN